MTHRFAARDGGEIEAMITDRYLESLLVFEPGPIEDAPAPTGLDPAVRMAASRLTRDLPRLHPSFRFEERLAARLAELAAGMRFSAAAGAEGVVVPLGRGHDASDGSDPSDPFAPYDPFDAFAGALDQLGRPDRVRPLIIGGALTSAAISLAGAAYVAWRRTRPPTTPMARAVRAVARGRLS
jgi:hypothetical protein